MRVAASYKVTVDGRSSVRHVVEVEREYYIILEDEGPQRLMIPYIPEHSKEKIEEIEESLKTYIKDRFPEAKEISISRIDEEGPGKSPGALEKLKGLFRRN